MANPNSVGELYLDSFGSGLVGIVSTQLNTAGNAVVTIPLLGGGLTNGGAAGNSGGVIIRRVTVCNPSGDISTANVAISVQSTGNVAAANAVVANVVLSDVSAAGRYQDLTVAGAYGANTAVSGATTSVLYVNVNTASGNNNTVQIRVYGDVVTF